MLRVLFSHLPGAHRDWWKITIFAVCVLFFLDRGPYRAVRYSTTGDFSTVYAAGRCWLHGSNPYDRASLKAELIAAGAPSGIQHDQDINPSVYLPAAMPWMVPFAMLPWKIANALWCLLLVVAFALSVRVLLRHSGLTRSHQWLAWAAILLFSPTYVGIYDGNPGVLAISLTTLSICLAVAESCLASGLLLGVVLCFKPQIALCGLCVFALWKLWKPPLLGLTLFLAASLLGILTVSHFGHDWTWWDSEQRNIATSFESGGQSDPAITSPVAWQMLNGQTLAAYAVPDRCSGNYFVWSLAGCLLVLRLSRTNADASPWPNVAFLAALTLLVTYHRYYDGQLLLLILPLWATMARNHKARFALMGVCLLVLAFPVQTVFARMLGSQSAQPSFKQFVLLRNQPAALLVLTAALAI